MLSWVRRVKERTCHMMPARVKERTCHMMPARVKERGEVRVELPNSTTHTN